MPGPDEQAFRADLTSVEFRRGVTDGRWGVLALDWPYAWIYVRAAQRDGSPDAFELRFELTNYPQQAPTAVPWDPALGSMLTGAKRPKGERVGQAFRVDWEEGRALYVPCDRVALTGHANWRQEHRRWAWTDKRKITHYLRLVSELLNDEDYTGV